MGSTILLADDDATIRKVLTRALTGVGCRVHSTSLLTTLTRWVAEGRGELVIIDVAMPDGNGIERLKEIKQIRPELPIIVISAQNTIMTAIQAQEAAAFAYLPKPFDLPELLIKVREALRLQKHQENRIIPVTDEELPLVGRAPIMQSMYQAIAKTLNSNLPLHLFGETGAGKSKIAEIVHECSDRRSLPIIEINPQSLEDPELTKGLFSRALGGTIVLEEIANLTLPAQQVLVHQLDDSGNSARIISTSQKDLSIDMAEKRFPRDLYFRLCADVIRVPSLKQRLDDIPLLANFFLQQLGKPDLKPFFTCEDVPPQISKYNWPGNVRELKNALTKATLLATGNQITWNDISQSLHLENTLLKSDSEPALEVFRERMGKSLEDYLTSSNGSLLTPGLYYRIVRELEMPLISSILKATRGNRSKCAEILGINKETLRKKIKYLDICNKNMINDKTS